MKFSNGVGEHLLKNKVSKFKNIDAKSLNKVVRYSTQIFLIGRTY